jgi:hypothetical protein
VVEASVDAGRRSPFERLLHDSRALDATRAIAREGWVATLTPERLDDLFEFETLLKGLVCFGNPRNHGGPTKRTAVVAQDFREAQECVAEATHRILALAERLLEGRGRAYFFQRYLETVLPDDGARARLSKTEHGTPEDSLYALRAGFANLDEVIGALARLPRVPFRTFHATIGIATREITQSGFFDPLRALEFRPEFDRPAHRVLVDLVDEIPDPVAARLVALTFLTLFRMLAYTDLLEAKLHERDGDRRHVDGTLHAILAALRSDARALTSYVGKKSGILLSESYDRRLFSLRSSELRDAYDDLVHEAVWLRGVKITLRGIAANLRLELRRVFEHELPAPEQRITGGALRARVAIAVALLRPAFQNAVVVLGRAFGAPLDETRIDVRTGAEIPALFDDPVSRRALSERLRRDVWMFGHVVRAFAEKARDLPPIDEAWDDAPPLAFVHRFLSYFRAMGYPLLRHADYPRFDAFFDALAELEDDDLAAPVRLQDAVVEAEAFHAFLLELFERIGQRRELEGIPFDRRGAALALKSFLAD